VATRGAHARSLVLVAAILWLPLAGLAGTGDLVSPSYRLRGAHEASLAAARLQSPGPRFGGSGAALGQSDALGFSSASATLSTSLPGFWPLTAGALPSLDLDGDGLLDAVESGTGVFVSAADTGTDPALVDSDGDGVSDGEEVDAGSDPNDPDSLPPAPAIPVAPVPIWILLILGLLASPLALRRRAGGS